MTLEEREVRRRMTSNELYKDFGPGLEALEEERIRGKELAARFNGAPPRDAETRQTLLRELLGSVGRDVWVEPPLYVAYGKNTSMGDGVYVNFGLTLVDDSEVIIGNEVMFGPHVTITTAGHPLHPDQRSTASQFSSRVVIEDRVWVGANVTILPGITVGYGSVVAAGAVVTANVAPMTIVGGVPARIIRAISEDDREWAWREPRTLGRPVEG